MALNISIDEWKEGIPQRELEQKIREYEEDFPKREIKGRILDCQYRNCV